MENRIETDIPAQDEVTSAVPAGPGDAGADGQKAGKSGRQKRGIPVRVFVFALIAALLVSYMAAFATVSNIYKTRIADLASERKSDAPDRLDTVVGLIKSHSYYEVDEDTLCRSLLGGYVNIVGDRYAYYYDEEEFSALISENSGDSQGIGVSIIEDTDHKCIKIIAVYEGSPAAAAGIAVGDRIISVGKGENAEPLSGMSYETAVGKLTGAAGTTAEFSVARGEDFDSAEIIDFSIKRDHFTTTSVMYRVSDLSVNGQKAGVIKITGFDLTTPVMFEKAMDELIAAGCGYFVFDVRYNPGGDLASITAVLSFFLREGDTVIRTVDRSGSEEKTTVAPVTLTGNYEGCSVSAEDIGKYREAAIGHSAVLANGSTASAAELFTSSLKDYGISLIVGEKTFGKGSMQSVFNLAFYGFPGGLKFTTKMYFPPLSEGYDGIGIEPDLAVEPSEYMRSKNIFDIADKDDVQLTAALDRLAPGH